MIADGTIKLSIILRLLLPPMADCRKIHRYEQGYADIHQIHRGLQCWRRWWHNRNALLMTFRRTALQVNSALHPSGVAKSTISFGYGKGRKVTTAGWQVTLCDPLWHVISLSGVIPLPLQCISYVTKLIYLVVSFYRTKQLCCLSHTCFVTKQKYILLKFRQHMKG